MPVEVIGVIGARTGVVELAGLAVTLGTDKEVMLSSDVKAETNEDWSEMKLLIELKNPLSAEGL